MGEFYRKQGGEDMKTKLTKEIIEEISKRLKVCCYVKTAIASMGITERSYYHWLERGQKAEKLEELGQKIPETEEIFFQFFQSVRQSDAEGEVNITTMIFSQVKDDWRAGIEMLARKYPEKWARKDSMSLSGSIETGPDKHEEAKNEYEEMFAGVPRAELSEIISETTKKLYDARSRNKGKTEEVK